MHASHATQVIFESVRIFGKVKSKNVVVSCTFFVFNNFYSSTTVQTDTHRQTDKIQLHLHKVHETTTFLYVTVCNNFRAWSHSGATYAMFVRDVVPGGSGGAKWGRQKFTLPPTLWLAEIVKQTWSDKRNEVQSRMDNEYRPVASITGCGDRSTLSTWIRRHDRSLSSLQRFVARFNSAGFYRS